MGEERRGQIVTEPPIDMVLVPAIEIEAPVIDTAVIDMQTQATDTEARATAIRALAPELVMCMAETLIPLPLLVMEALAVSLTDMDLGPAIEMRTAILLDAQATNTARGMTALTIFLAELQEQAIVMEAPQKMKTATDLVVIATTLVLRPVTWTTSSLEERAPLETLTDTEPRVIDMEAALTLALAPLVRVTEVLQAQVHVMEVLQAAQAALAVF